MTITRRSTIEDWPPNINWRLLDGGASDPSVPRRFLKEESWKLLLAPNPVLEEDASGGATLTIPVFIPDNLKKLPEPWVDYWLQSVIGRRLTGFTPSLDPSSTKILFEVVPIKHFEPDRQDKICKIFRSRALEEWLKLYVKGQYFASQIGRAGEDRYVFIEEIYCQTEQYDEAASAYLDHYLQPVLIKGIPRAGKTYTALRLLYKALDDSEATIQIISSWSDPTELLDSARELSDHGGKLFAVLDDPFGVDDYDDNVTSTSVEIINSLAANISQNRLLITTRDEVYRVAKKEKLFLGSLRCTEISFTPEGTKRNRIRNLEMLERTAWLHGANWLTQYRQHLDNPEPEEPSELSEAWEEVVQQSYVPGVLLSAFILYPHIVNLNIQDPAEVRNLALALGRAFDVWSAFRSELDTLLRNARSEGVLYLLLPSLTLVQEKMLDRLFTPQERQELEGKLGQYFEATVGDDFAVDSYRYKLDIFAEVAQNILEEDGLKFLKESILPEMARRVPSFGQENAAELLAELLADILTRYFWLGGRIGNHDVITLMQALKRYSTGSRELVIALQWDQINVLGALFQSEKPRLGYDLLVKKLTEAAPLLVSNLASVLDQLLINQDGERIKLVERVAHVVGDLHTQYFASQEADEAALRGSLLLHGALSHLEKYFEADHQIRLIPSPESGNGDKLFLEMLGVEPLLQRIGQGGRDWVRPVVMWLDAIIMKLGELRLYLIEHEAILETNEDQLVTSADKQPAKLFEIAGQQNIACGVLYTRLLDQLERVTTAILNDSGVWELAFIEGGLFFTLAWHNRWCSAGDALNHIAQWAEASGLLGNSSDQDGYWTGICFNMDYHAKYFEAKASAWQRESAMYRLHRDKGPRLGADTLHESGLPANKQRKDWNSRFELFYRNCVDQLLPSNSHAFSLPTSKFPRIVVAAAFLLGMRAPREPDLNDRYCARVQYAVEVESCPWRQDFWRAITKLFAFNLRDSIELVKRGISRCEPKAIRRGNVQLLSVIEDIENEFKANGARYVSANLELLRKSLNLESDTDN